jgi:hypothetical protein
VETNASFFFLISQNIYIKSVKGRNLKYIGSIQGRASEGMEKRERKS